MNDFLENVRLYNYNYMSNIVLEISDVKIIDLYQIQME